MTVSLEHSRDTVGDTHNLAGNALSRALFLSSPLLASTIWALLVARQMKSSMTMSIWKVPLRRCHPPLPFLDQCLRRPPLRTS